MRWTCSWRSSMVGEGGLLCVGELICVIQLPTKNHAVGPAQQPEKHKTNVPRTKTPRDPLSLLCDALKSQSNILQRVRFDSHLRPSLSPFRGFLVKSIPVARTILGLANF